MQQDIWRGIRRALPMSLGYVVIGFSVAATAYGAGFNALNTVLMSAMVAAGTSQLIATQLLCDGAPLASVIATTFIVNLRHLLMSSALAPQLSTFRRPQLALFCYGLTDESFALHSSAAARGHFAGVAEMMAANICLHVSWIVGAVIAVALGTDAAFLHAWGLDFSPQAMFIALLALLIVDRMQLVIAAFCAVVSVLLHHAGAGAQGVMITTILGATFGMWGEEWFKSESSTPSRA